MKGTMSSLPPLMNGQADRAEDRRKILIVDDKPNVLEHYLAILRDEFNGHDLAAVPGLASVKAWAEANASLTDVVIFDFQLADGTAAEALAELRKNGFSGSVIVITDPLQNSPPPDFLNSVNCLFMKEINFPYHAIVALVYHYIEKSVNDRTYKESFRRKKLEAIGIIP